MQYPIYKNLNNCKLFNNDVEYDLDYIDSDNEYRFSLVPDLGFIFKTQPFWKCGNNRSTFWMNPDFSLAQMVLPEFKPFKPDGYLRITGCAFYKHEPVIYSLTDDELEQVERKYWPNINNKGEIFQNNGYILRFHGLHCRIDTDKRGLVYIGKFNTNIECDIVRNYQILDLGDIVVTPIFNNSLDYETRYILHLPFIGDIELDPNLILNKTINLVYELNVMTGNVSGLLYSDNELIMNCGSGNISYSIPFVWKHSPLSNNVIMDTMNGTSDVTPYLDIVSPNRYGDEPDRILDNHVWVAMNTCSGFCKFGDVQFNPVQKINKDEYDEVINKLLQGVIF